MCVIPFLFIGFKPYYQVVEHKEIVVKRDSINICIECEALKIIEYKHELDSLETRRLKLKKELKKLKEQNSN